MKPKPSPSAPIFQALPNLPSQPQHPLLLFQASGRPIPISPLTPTLGISISGNSEAFSELQTTCPQDRDNDGWREQTCILIPSQAHQV